MNLSWFLKKFSSEDRFYSVIKKFPEEKKLIIKPRPYFNHSVEMKGLFSAEERAEMLENIGLNVFFFPSEMITGCDFLSDSGITTMVNEQWLGINSGDEAYFSNKGYNLIFKQIRDIFGEDFFNVPDLEKRNAFIFNQGSSAENAFFTQFRKKNAKLIIPGNGHTDTTQANMEFNGIEPLTLLSSELMTSSFSRFKGDINLFEFKNLLEKQNDRIPLVYLTITNHKGGGQPVSIKNIAEVAEISHSQDIPLFMEASKCAENAWFIKQYEKGYENKSIKEIIREIMSYADGFTINFKNDALANTGGGIFIKNNGLFMKKYPKMAENITAYQIQTEGPSSCGGLSTRDMISLNAGLKAITNEKYLAYRLKQIQEFGHNMFDKGLPVLTPIGSAVYLDINKFFADTGMKPDNFGGIAFTSVLLAAYGHRASEFGYFAFGKYDPKTKQEIHPDINFVRFAIPRLRYEKQDLDSVAEAVRILHENKDMIPPVEVIYGQNLPLRHFKARFKFRI